MRLSEACHTRSGSSTELQKTGVAPRARQAVAEQLPGQVPAALPQALAALSPAPPFPQQRAAGEQHRACSMQQASGWSPGQAASSEQ